MPQRKPPDGALLAIVFVVAFGSSLALRGAGLPLWQRLVVQALAVLLAAAAWSRWRSRRR